MGKNDIKVAFVPMSEYWTSVGRVQPTTCRHTKLLSLEKSTHIHMSRRNRGLLYSVCLRWYNYNLTWYGNHILPLKGKGLKKLWNNSPPKLDDGAKTLHVHVYTSSLTLLYVRMAQSTLNCLVPMVSCWTIGVWEERWLGKYEMEIWTYVHTPHYWVIRVRTVLLITSRAVKNGY